MVRYRRNHVAGATYFFTVTLRNRRGDALVRNIDLLRESWRCAMKRVPHEVIAAVVLPDHLHAVLTMQDNRDDYSRLWQEIKKGFTRRLGAPSPWQSRFWEHTIRSESDLSAHVDYVHFNPVKHGLVASVSAWPQSTFHRYVRSGQLPADWAGSREFPQGFGER
ncbi:transposase [Lysobacter sp. S4-A87]|uniref:REP-associated tyrosine transposase n=1 Tax=Lysobacter sp. S4-A87 TaxID=2925843 RepID=UPI001F530AC3|nr:transposase [Lysobacter sp. S4-A87]UNK48722.1 transposase [Lysobacter sp. S4-A87]